MRRRGGVARSTRLCADSGNRAETAASAAVWQWRRKEWSNAKKIPPERERKGKRQTGEGEEAQRGHAGSHH